MSIAAILLAAVQATAVPPPVEQVAADCAHPTYATDLLVCHDPVLRAMDADLRSLPAPSMSTGLLESRADWFRRSRRCAFQATDRSCTQAAYVEALTVATALSSSPPKSGRCRLRNGEHATFAATGADGALMRNGQVIGYARPASSVWRSFLTLERVGKRITFRDLAEQTVATCRLGA